MNIFTKTKSISLSGPGACYMRVSTLEQDISRQTESINRWLEHHGVQIPKHLRFIDDGYGRDIASQRPEFQRMLKMVEVGLISWIVSDSQDRFGSKDKYEFASFMHHLREADCKFVTVDDKCWNDDDMGAFLEGSFGAETSEKEQQVKSQRTITARIRDAKLGKWAGGHVAYGIDAVCYDKNDNEKWRVVVLGRELIETKPGKGENERRVNSTFRLKCFPDGTSERFDGNGNFPKTEQGETVRLAPSLDQAKLAVIREIFTKYALEDICPTQITTHLNRLGVEHHYAGTWANYHVRQMLENPIYVGYQRWNRNAQGRFNECSDGMVKSINNPGQRRNNSDQWILSAQQLFEPIVSPEIFEKVQQRLSLVPVLRRSPKSADLWLSGILVCERCGKKMRAVNRGTRREYICSSYAKESKTSDCLRNCVNHDLIEAELMKYLEETNHESLALQETYSTGNLEILNPFRKKHEANIIECARAFYNMCKSVHENDDWESVLMSCGKKSDFRKPNSPDEYRETFKPYERAYQLYFVKNNQVIQEQRDKLESEHDKLLDRITCLDEATTNRAINKIKNHIAEIESQLNKLDESLTNWGEIHRERSEQLFACHSKLIDAISALNDSDASARRKSLAVRKFIKQIDLRFEPTGKKYPTSQLVEIRFIPALEEYPDGASD